MNYRLSQHALVALVPLAAATAALAGGGLDADIFWADRWNSIYHQFSDANEDGLYVGVDEIGFLIDPASEASLPASMLDVTRENGQKVFYWLPEYDDTILRGSDLNGDTLITGGEYTVFRDSGTLDGESWPQDLKITDDGAVWWAAGKITAHPVKGLFRLEDLNGDGDAADAGEQIVMIDGNGSHAAEHDAGSSNITAWAISTIASAGNGVMAYIGFGYGDDESVYLFEDLNDDGDLLDPGESVLLLNAAGESPNLPQNPDFADGTLKNVLGQNGYYAGFSYIASSMEDGVRAFYFGTRAGWQESLTGATNVNGEGVNFLIFRGVDLNGDRDVNDAGEVKLFIDGSHSDGDPNLFTLRGIDALDGGVIYAVGLKPFPVLFPGPNGNTWIHRFEDLNGDGDAMDPGEKQLEVFELQDNASTGLFPVPLDFGNVMCDPWFFAVHPRIYVAPADLDANDAIGFSDLTLLLAAWGTPAADVDGNGSTGFSDLTITLNAWGRYQQ